MIEDAKMLWCVIEQEMSSFETGGSGFFALPSGKPITTKAAAKKFRRIARLAEKAERALLAPGVTGEKA